METPRNIKNRYLFRNTMINKKSSKVVETLAFYKLASTRPPTNSLERAGQYIWRRLYDKYSHINDLDELMRDVKYDCFYDDNLIENFIKMVEGVLVKENIIFNVYGNK